MVRDSAAYSERTIYITLHAKATATVSFDGVRIITNNQASGHAVTSPPLAEKLLYLLLPRDQREHLPGCLEEEFTTVILPKFGARYARFWYWCQVIRSVGPILRASLMRWAGYAGGAAGLVKAVDWLRRWNS